MAVTTAPQDAAPVEITPGFWTRPRRVGAVLVGLGVLAAVVFGLLAPAGQDARFTFSRTTAGTALPIPARPGAVVFGLIGALAGAALLSGRADRRVRALAGLFGAAFMVSFLCWQVAGQRLPLGDVSQGTVAAAVPLVFGAMAGVLCERSGVINVAIEGQILSGAFAGALVGTIAGSAWAGLFGAAAAGLVIAGMLAALSIRYLVDQVVLGVVLNLFAVGLTTFLYLQIMQPASDRYNFPPIFPAWRIPVLSSIPVLGPGLFDGNVLVYLAIGTVVLVHVGLFHTRWGLRTRAVGEHPTAADTVGIRVRGMRYRNVLLAGVVAGLGGAFLTIGNVGQFNTNMSAGRGFIALAALIFGRWSPLGATAAALLFGFFGKLASSLGTIGSTIPNEFLGMLPYVVTIVAVAGLVGRVRAPAADGKPYVKG